MHKFRNPRSVLLGMAVLALMSACLPVPDQQLTKDQKKADMMWLYSTFDENYAPLSYKVKRFGLNYKTMKDSFMAEALHTTNNEQFYQVMHRFVAKFQDAHTAGSLSHGGLPHRAEIAYIGISGRRQGDVFVVTELLPTYQKNSSFPIHVGDEISMLDGKPLKEIVKNEMVSLKDIGHEEANLTFHMNRIFNRVSLSHVLPTQEDAEITIVGREYTKLERETIEDEESVKIPVGAKKEVKIVVYVPWIVKDLFEFRKEQRMSKGTGKVSSSTDMPKSVTSLLDLFKLDNEVGSNPIFMAFRGFDGSIKAPYSSLIKTIRGSESFKFLNTFYFPSQVEGWTSDVKLDESSKEVAVKSTLSQFTSVRSIPKDAIFITDPAATFPTYITEERLHDRSGEEKYGVKRIATLYLSTFSPSASEEKVLEEFNETLEKLQRLGVNDLVIDLINNGGGSLSLGMKLAQALSTEKILMPAIQFRTSQTWRDEFLQMSLNGASDSERLLAKRMYDQLQAEMKAGERLSSPVNADVLIPFELNGNDRLRKNFHTVLLVNEMCASMCDMFSAMMQDNHLAIIAGSRTMGAGGNVVTHIQAPNSHFFVSQTESLMVRRVMGAQGPELSDYVENQGVDPDVWMDVSADSGTKYRTVREGGVYLLTQVQENRKRNYDHKRKRPTPYDRQTPRS